MPKGKYSDNDDAMDISIRAYTHGQLVFEKTYKKVTYESQWEDGLLQIDIEDSFEKAIHLEFFEMSVSIIEE